ncbi:hypothetical protein VPH35_097476 [Triticum aestivum]|uniref:Uncharacterized protein n=1 Tax=Aegilops tauschii subsp. strangulata TaxID=200361 RepID=A0A453KNJ7_AEGTS
MVCSPIASGGRGIQDMQQFSRALWKNPERPWVGSELPCVVTNRALFNAATMVTIGDSTTASFGDCSWMGSATLRIAFPLLLKHSRRKKQKRKRCPCWRHLDQ